MFLFLVVDRMLEMMCRYPLMSEEDFEQACPVCRGNCNCINCLRKKGPSRVGFFKSIQFLLGPCVMLLLYAFARDSHLMLFLMIL